jgi:PAS domain S-box-containing protein
MSRRAVELSEPEIMYCFAYGAHFVAPIIIDGERKATMYAGQFRPDKFSPEQLKELEKIAVEIDLDPESLVEEAKNMRTVRGEMVLNCLHSFFRTVKVIAELGAQAFELRRTKDALQKAHDGLEMRVQERTAELTETNEELGREIVERKAAEEALRESEAKYRLFTETSKDAILSYDMDGRITYLNRAAIELGGYSEEEALQMNITDILPRDQLSGFYERFSMRAAGGSGIVLYEVDFINKSGERISVEVSSSMIAEDGKPAGLLLACRDITERKRTEDALRKSEEKYRALFETAKDAIFLSDEIGNFVDVNQAACESLGYSREELLRLSNREIDADPTGYEAFLKVRNALAEEAIFEVNQQRKDGTLLPVEITGKFFETDGELLSLAIARDITERKKAEETMRVSEEKYKALYDNAPLSYQSLNEDGSFNDVNPAWIRTLGYDRKEVIGKWFGDFLHQDWKPHFEKNFQEFKRRGYIHDVQFKIRHKDGHYLDISFEGYIGYNPDGSFKQTYCVFQDITERKLVEEELKASQLKYRQLFETMTCGVAIYEAMDDGDDFIFRDLNQAGENIENVKKEDVIGRRVIEAFPGVREFGLFKVFQRVWRTGKPGYFPEAIYRDERDLGTWRENWVYKLPSGEIVAIYNDITERKQVEQSLLEAEAELKHIIEVVPGIIAKVNAHTGYFTYCNPALSSILGFSPEEFLARPFIEFVHPDDRQSTINEVEKQLKGSPLAMFENRYICKNGSYKWLEWRATAADEKEVIYAAATDITERKAAEEQIKRSLREKDVLMQEIHHRVKNNLQVVSSLLSMQARTTRNKEAIDVLSKSQSRINTMALIHTQLYESGDLSELNMKEFVGTLSEELFQSYPVTDTKITPIVHVTDRKFPISVGMYVGLIINELLSNAIEHAFGGRKAGTIEVDLTVSDSGRVNLRVSDDGAGLPPGFDIDKTRSLGLHLVKILLEDQLQGKLEVVSDGGVTFNMEFDIECNGGSSYGEDKNTDR